MWIIVIRKTKRSFGKRTSKKKCCKEARSSSCWIFNCFLATLKNLESSYFPYSSYAKACCHMKVPLWQIIFGVSWQTKPALYWLAVFVNNLHKSTEWKGKKYGTEPSTKFSPPVLIDVARTTNRTKQGVGVTVLLYDLSVGQLKIISKSFEWRKKAQIMICISDVDDVLFMNRQGNIFTDDIIPCSFIHSNHQILRNFFLIVWQFFPDF